MHSAALVDEIVRALRRPRPAAPDSRQPVLLDVGGVLWGAPDLVTLSVAGEEITVDVPGENGGAWRLGAIRGGSTPVLEVSVGGDALVAATGELGVARAVVALATVWRRARQSRGA